MSGHVERYFVKTPISRGGLFRSVTIVGAPTGGDYVVRAGHVIEVAADLSGPEKERVQFAIGKWMRLGCIEPFDAVKHCDAVLSWTDTVQPAAATRGRR